jgi:hypothetical protein
MTRTPSFTPGQPSGGYMYRERPDGMWQRTDEYGRDYGTVPSPPSSTAQQSLIPLPTKPQPRPGYQKPPEAENIPEVTFSETHPLESGSRDVIPQPDWKVSQKSESGKIQAYIDSEGVTHYTPEHTMFRVGYRTDKDWRENRRIVEHDASGEERVRFEIGGGNVAGYGVSIEGMSPYVAIDTPKGLMHITKAEHQALLKINDREDAIETLRVLLGLPEDSPMLPADRRLAKAIIKGKLNLDEYVAAGIDDPEIYKSAGFKVTQEDINQSLERISKRNQQEYKPEKAEKVTEPASTKKGRDIPLKKLLKYQEIIPTLPMVSDRVTAAQKYLDPVETSLFESYLIKLGAPAPLIAGLGITAATPIPYDEAALILIIFAAIGATKAINYLKGNTKKGINTSDVKIAAVSGDNQAIWVDQSDLLPYGIIPNTIKRQPETGTKIIPPIIPYTGNEQIIPPKYKLDIPGFKGEQPKALVMITPSYPRRALSNILWAAATVEATKINLGITIQETGKFLPTVQAEKVKSLTVSGEYDRALKILRDASEGKGLPPGVKISAMSRELALARRVYEDYHDAHQEYLAKLAIYLAAKKSFINSTNPQPIKGSLSGESASVLAGLTLKNGVNNKTKSNRMSLDEVLENDTVVSTIIDKSLKKYTELFQRAFHQGKTASQAQTEAMTALRQSIQTQVKKASKTATKTAVKTATKTMTREAIRQAIQTATMTAEMTRTAERTMTAEQTAEDDLTKTKLKYLTKGGGDSVKRRIIAESGGAIAWRMGKIGGKDRWDTVINPYKSNAQYLMVLGKPPAGATILKRGPGSAYATAQMLRGAPPKGPVKIDSGFMDINIKPHGRTIDAEFTPDPDDRTRGDITIGHVTPRIMPRSPRITPKTPRLR